MHSLTRIPYVQHALLSMCRVSAAVEECRNPALRGQPLAVTQKYLVVTANYPARAAGVTK